jgi:hypothetical protein
VNADVNTLRQLIDQVRQKEQNVAVLLASVIDGKVLLIAGLSRDLTAKKFDAVEWVKFITPLIGGKGGGRPDMAQGGGVVRSKFFCRLYLTPNTNFVARAKFGKGSQNEKTNRTLPVDAALCCGRLCKRAGQTGCRMFLAHQR